MGGMERDQHPNWHMELSAPIVLNDGTTLRTLRESYELLNARFDGKRNRLVLDATIMTLADAAESGNRDEIYDATRLLDLLLTGEKLK